MPKGLCHCHLFWYNTFFKIEHWFLHRVYSHRQDSLGSSFGMTSTRAFWQVLAWHNLLLIALIIWLGLLPARRQILGRRSCCLGCVLSLNCPSCPDLLKNQLVRECSLNILSTFLAGILWTACQIQHVFKQNESDNCRLKVCSLPLYKNSAPHNEHKCSLFWVCLALWASNSPETDSNK